MSFFFFKQKTAYEMRISDWSSDVCSSDLRLAELERKAESARALYMAFLDRYKQTRAQRGLERSDSYVVGRARVPSVPSSPNLLTYLVLGIVAALGASAAAVDILQLLERGIETSDAVEKKLGVMSLGSITEIGRAHV